MENGGTAWATSNGVTTEELEAKDYATIGYVDTEIAEVKAECIQQTPLFANSVDELEENGDTSKVYVLPDGYIYGYIKSNIEGELELGTNMLTTALGCDGEIMQDGDGNVLGYADGHYLSGSASNPFKNVSYVGDDSTHFLTGFIPYTLAQANAGVPIYIKGVTIDTTQNYTRAATYNTYSDYSVYHAPVKFSTGYITVEQLDEQFYKLTLTSDFISAMTTTTVASDFAYIRFSFSGSGDGVVITTDVSTSSAETYAWQNTGHAFVPADYEERINNLEDNVTILKTAIQGDMAVYGIVDSENNVYMTGTLSSGTYTLKYQNDDGTLSEIGTFTME